MIPFVFTIAFSFISFLASAFVILRIVIPILPPHPLSRRVAPSEFGLPDYNFHSLSAADKSHLWLASLDLLALSIFIWQAVSEYSDGAAGFADARDVGASARIWFALTIRQSCLFVVSGLALVYIRMGRSVSFGRNHWMVWVPTLLLTLMSTILAAVLAGAGIPTLFAGIVVYSAITAVFSTAAFGGLVYTLVVIKRNLAAVNEPTDTWPPIREAEEKHRLSFASEDIDRLREGSSWLSSDAGSSRHESMSNWSFSTHHSLASQPPLQPKSSYWYNSPLDTNSSIPPVPPLPSAYLGNTSPICVANTDPDPFRRNIPSRPRLGSQSSWLTSPSVSQASLSAWSYPATITANTSDVVDIGVGLGLLPTVLPSRPATPMTSTVDLNAGLLPQVGPSRPPTPALSGAKVLGGYGYTSDSEKGIVSLAVTGGEVNISCSRYALWLLSIWVPFVRVPLDITSTKFRIYFQGLSAPYLISIASSGSVSVGALSMMLVLSVTLSSPLLALNILVRSPIPIPAGLFGVYVEPPSVIMRAPSPVETLGSSFLKYKTSGRVTVVQGRRSGDVWVSQGDAVDGRGKFGRALGLIAPLPRLAILPPEEQQEEGEITPPLPMQEETTLPPTPQSTNSAELGRICKKPRASSHFSGDETFATRIMVAQRHYSAVATTVVVPASPKRTEDGPLSVATGINVAPTIVPLSSSHLRSRSVSSIIGQAAMIADISVPPSQPLPPTPPSIRHAKQTARLFLHRKSRSSELSFGVAVNDDIKEIDALTAGVLPLLVPGLKLGEEMKIRNWEEFPPPPNSTVTKKHSAVTNVSTGFEFGILGRDNLASPVTHSTPAQEGQNRRKVSRHKRNHFSLPSLGLDKDGFHNWKDDLTRALITETGKYASLPARDTNRCNRVLGGEAVSNFIVHPATEHRVEQPASMTGSLLGRLTSTCNVGLRVEVPQTANSARTSLATLIPPSAASTVTLFEVEDVFEPVAQSTPYGTQKGKPLSMKNQASAMIQTTSSRRPSIVYFKSNERPSELVTCVDPNPFPMTLAPPAAKLHAPSKAGTLRRKSNMSENRLTNQSGGLRPLSLLKDRDTNKEGDASKLAGTRPLVLGKKKLKMTRDENSPNSGNKHLKPLQLGRSESSKMRGMLRRNEVLPTVVVRPPSTNAKT